MSNAAIINLHDIEKLIFNIRGFQVMIDFHLAEMYGVETKRLNEQVKRNLRRFPDTFMFQLTAAEWEDLQPQIATAKQPNSLRSQIATLENQRGKHRKFMPYVFTEQGVAMLSAVLNSDVAIDTSVIIMQAFVKMRIFLLQNASLFQRIESLEIKQIKTDDKIEQIFSAIDAGQLQPQKGIFFDGQMFDAYVFVSALIKKTKIDIVLIDNYVDETVLTLLAKRTKNVKALIYTKTISKQLELDLTKHNSQYPPIEVKTFANSHDRFLLIDGTELYHLGASLKDLGKKWFAFSRMDSLAGQVMNQLKEEKV